MSEQRVAPADVRLCGYRKCRKALPPKRGTGGREREYCPEGTQLGWRSCKDQEVIERRAERAAGIEAPLDRFQETAERLLPDVGALAEVVSALIGNIHELRDGALGRITQAEATTREAIERAERAEQEERQARSLAADSTAAAKEAKSAEQTADRLRRDAEAEARREIGKERDKTLAHEVARAKALEQATAAKADLRALQARFNELATAHDALIKENREVSKARAVADRERDAAVAARDEALTLAEQRGSEAAAARTAEAAARSAAEATAGERDTVRADLEGARGELVAVREQAAQGSRALDQARGELVAVREGTAQVRAALDQAQAELAQERQTVATVHAQLAEQGARLEAAVAAAAEAKEGLDVERQERAKLWEGLARAGRKTGLAIFENGDDAEQSQS